MMWSDRTALIRAFGSSIAAEVSRAIGHQSTRRLLETYFPAGEIRLTEEGVLTFATDNIREVVTKFIRVVQRVLGGAFGATLPERIFQATYDALKKEVRDPEELTALLELVPENALEREKVRYLSRERLEQRVLERTKDLQELNTNLEQTVQKRTKTLAQLNEDLQKANAEREAQFQVVEREEKKLETVLASLGEGVVGVSPDRKIFLMNRMAERLLGWTKEEAMIQPYTDVLQFKDAAGIVAHPILGILETREQRAVRSYTLTRRDRSNITILLTATPLEFRGQLLGVLAVLRDVTQEREIDRMKSNFISIAAHQLRTPLSALKWAFDMLLKKDLGPLAEEQESVLKKAKHINETVISLVNGLLDIARIEEGRFEYRWTSVDLLQLLRKIHDDFQLKAESKKIRYELNLPEHVPLITGDVERLQLVFQNLFDNALNYTRQGGVVTIRCTQRNDVIEVRVEDTGIGIAPQDQPKLFTKFFRAAEAKIVQTAGSGLGLYLVKNIVQQHGGDIDFQSVYGKGSIFTVRLPLHFQPPPSREDVLRS